MPCRFSRTDSTGRPERRKFSDTRSEEIRLSRMDLTVGLNWYLNRWVWVQSNFEHTIFERPLTLGSGGRALGFQDALALRATVMF